jgi:hypothetical protein
MEFVNELAQDIINPNLQNNYLEKHKDSLILSIQAAFKNNIGYYMSLNTSCAEFVKSSCGLFALRRAKGCMETSSIQLNNAKPKYL